MLCHQLDYRCNGGEVVMKYLAGMFFFFFKRIKSIALI